MSKPKLSATQVKVLKFIKDTGSISIYYNRNTLEILNKYGFLKRGVRGLYTATITSAGRDYLAALEGKEDA